MLSMQNKNDSASTINKKGRFSNDAKTNFQNVSSNDNNKWKSSSSTRFKTSHETPSFKNQWKIKRNFQSPLIPRELFSNETPVSSSRWNSTSLHRLDTTFNWFSNFGKPISIVLKWVPKGESFPMTEEEIKNQKKVEQDIKTDLSKKEVELGREELVDLLRAQGRITNYDVLSRGKGPITLKVYRDDGFDEIIQNFKASDLHLGEWREVMQDPIIKLNTLAKKKRKHADDFHEYFSITGYDPLQLSPMARFFALRVRVALHVRVVLCVRVALRVGFALHVRVLLCV
ncbi:hypothetical protein Tco_0437909 [Tanacetum coccineum]